MKRILTCFPLLIICFNSPYALSDQSSNTPVEVSSKTYTRWLSCGNYQLPVPQEPTFKENGIEAYAAGMGELIIKLTDNTSYCAHSTYGWKLDGFVYGVNQENKEQRLFFKLSSPQSEHYVDVLSKKILYRVSDINARLEVAPEPQAEPGIKININQQWSGDKSRIMQPFFYRIMTPEKWALIWKEHSDEPLPEIDFKQFMVLAIFLGQTSNRSGVEIDDAREIEDGLRVRYEVKGFQTGSQAVLTSPFGIFVLPQSSLPIQLEENTQGLINGPAQWSLKGHLPQGDSHIEGPKRKIISPEEFNKQSAQSWEEIKHFLDTATPEVKSISPYR